jgi:hypothetical protein
MAPAQPALSKSIAYPASHWPRQASHRFALDGKSTMSANENRRLKQHFNGTGNQFIVLRSMV